MKDQFAVENNHYERPQLLESIRAALKEQGLDEAQLTRQDISLMDEFHLQGAKISLDLAHQAQLTPGQRVLDVGCGIGGPCRMMADVFGCRTVGIDYTSEYVRTARALSEWVGLDHLTDFIEGSALDLPFEDHSFDLVWTQHAQMNIEDKPKMYQEIKRVLKPGGLFVYYDIFQGDAGGIIFPVPWAEHPNNSYLMRLEAVSDHFPSSSWTLMHQEDHTLNAKKALEEILEKVRAGEGPSLGLNLLMGASTYEKLGNLYQCLLQKIVEVHAGVYKKGRRTKVEGRRSKVEGRR